MRTCFETTDIFRGAFFLSKGGDLADIRVRSNGKRIATFFNHVGDPGRGDPGRPLVYWFVIKLPKNTD